MATEEPEAPNTDAATGIPAPAPAKIVEPPANETPEEARARLRAKIRQQAEALLTQSKKKNTKKKKKKADDDDESAATGVTGDTGLAEDASAVASAKKEEEKVEEINDDDKEPPAEESEQEKGEQSEEVKVVAKPTVAKPVLPPTLVEEANDDDSSKDAAPVVQNNEGKLDAPKPQDDDTVEDEQVYEYVERGVQARSLPKEEADVDDSTESSIDDTEKPAKASGYEEAFADDDDEEIKNMEEGGGRRGGLAAFKSAGEEPEAGHKDDTEEFVDVEVEEESNFCTNMTFGVLFCVCLLVWAIIIPVTSAAIANRKTEAPAPPEVEATLPPLFTNGTSPTEIPPTGTGILPDTTAPTVVGGPTAGTTPLELDLPAYTVAALEDPTSAQSKANAWIQGDPDASKYSPERNLQRFALATFYYATGGENWVNSDAWLDYSIHECFWYSEIPACNTAQEYNFLKLNSNGLIGSVPAEISLLGNLEELHLEDNSITGMIPAELALLQELNLLNLQSNKLQAPFPTELGLMTSLGRLWLNNTFDNMTTVTSGGPIPSELGMLSNLTELYMAENMLTGTIPIELSGLSNAAEVLSFRTNNLTGPIPIDLTLLTKLAAIDFGQNQLTGVIPDDIVKLSSTLVSVQLDNNDLVGTIPVDIARLTNLVDISLEGNMLTGLVPGGLCYYQLIGKVSISVDCDEVLCTCDCQCFTAPGMEKLTPPPGNGGTGGVLITSAPIGNETDATRVPVSYNT